MKQNEVKMLEADEQKYMHECKSVFSVVDGGREEGEVVLFWYLASEKW